MTAIEQEHAVMPAHLAAAAAALVAQVQASVVQVRNGQQGIGAGVIWRSSGRLLTNAHVIASAPRTVQVVLHDGRQAPAQVLDYHTGLDLALLQVDTDSSSALPAATPGDSRGLRVGALVFAIGHPWGQRGIVTAGLLSGRGQATLPGQREPVPYLLSDVLLRPGNSGGPLVDAHGTVVGINSMIRGGDLSVAIPTHVITAWLAAGEQEQVTLI
jgi:serine protease Do